MQRRTFLRQSSALAAALAGLTAPAVRAQQGPTRIITPYAAGGGADLIARLVADQMGKASGTTHIVEPRPGGAGRIANNAAITARPDGKTLLLQTSSAYTITVHTYKNPKEQELTSMVPLGALSPIDFVLYVHAGVPAKTVADYIRLVRSDDKLRFFGTSGLGNITHFFGLMLAGVIKVPLQDVPFQGGAPALVAVMSGQVPGGISSVGGALVNAHKEGRIRILATMSARRNPFIPDVPTMTEAGVPEIALNDWVGLFAPTETPAAVAEPIAANLAQVTRSPTYNEGLVKLLMAPMVASPAECTALLKRDYAIWQPIVKASGFKEA